MPCEIYGFSSFSYRPFVHRRKNVDSRMHRAMTYRATDDVVRSVAREQHFMIDCDLVDYLQGDVLSLDATRCFIEALGDSYELHSVCLDSPG